MIGLRKGVTRLGARRIDSLLFGKCQAHRFLSNSSKDLHRQKTILKSSFGGLAASLLGASLLSYYMFNAKSSVHEYVFGPLLRNIMDAETAHHFVVKLMSYGLFPRLFEGIKDEDKVLGVKLFNNQKYLEIPIGMAAGLDKNAEAIDALFNIGFSYVEVGSITPLPQPGNPQPRFFRIPNDRSVINRYGFNSDGHWSVLSNLRIRVEKFLTKFNGNVTAPNSFEDGKILAVNLGKNKHGDEINDYKLGVSRFGPYADVLVINVSSPNTPGLRNLQKKEKLLSLLDAVVEERNNIKLSENPLNKGKSGQLPPIVVKIAPDLTESEIKSIAETVNESKIDGIIISNTTISRPTVYNSPEDPIFKEAGGLSGVPLKPISLKALRTFAKYNKDPKLTIIGCGGISTGQDAIEFAKAGASFVQVYTGFAYTGPNLVNRIAEEIKDELKKEGKTWEQIVGADLKK
ncbi:dihydroorotate dehydrogenase [Saccharomycopsis crataegensis]|uniref:Dihydroorotate dehydrogenase (quinone), mitochondrial n=1 Tax=Saccharomycopsis crataegensis TaxID=43959 RepID=A0AAV5QNY5_9ASCO|nr:dihydroorotate dehydrogenase [Saccharomycopsis crataegensis]